MKKIQFWLARSWSSRHHHLKSEYEVKGEYDVLCQDDESQGWEHRHLDLISVEEGTLVELLDVDKDGFETRTLWIVSPTGLIIAPRT